MSFTGIGLFSLFFLCVLLIVCPCTSTVVNLIEGCAVESSQEEASVACMCMRDDLSVGGLFGVTPPSPFADKILWTRATK